MNRVTFPAALAGVLALGINAAYGHAVCGARIFPVTLTLDDPGVADEASIPTFTWQRSGAGADRADQPVPFQLRIRQAHHHQSRTGVQLWRRDPAGCRRQDRTGFQNLFATLKYATCVSPDHEFQLGVGLQREFGGTGTFAIGADAYGSTTPTLYAGKGLGDLPIGSLRALAITGEFSYTIADRSLKATQMTDRDTGLMSLQYNNGNPNSWFGGVSVQYSLPYLQSQVKDYGLPPVLGRLTPIVEVTWSSPATKPSTQGTTWTVAPGVLYRATGTSSASRR